MGTHRSLAQIEGLLAALEFDAHVTKLIQTLQTLCLSMGLLDLKIAARKCGSFVFPTIVIIISLALDAASSNLLAVKKVIARYKKYNATNPFNIIVLVAATLCKSHQCHICSKTSFGALGVLKRLASTRIAFIPGLTASCKTFSSATYYVRIMASANSTFCNVLVLSPAEAAARNILMSSATETQMKETLLLYLLRWVRGCAGFESDKPIAKAVHLLATYINVPWIFGSNATLGDITGALIHICIGPLCFCHLIRNLGLELVKAFGLMLGKRCGNFSEGRWTAASPSFAYFAVWNLIRLRAAAAMSSAFVKGKIAEAGQYLSAYASAEIAGQQAAEAFDAWKLESARCLIKTSEFTSDMANLTDCILGVHINHRQGMHYDSDQTNNGWGHQLEKLF